MAIAFKVKQELLEINVGKQESFRLRTELESEVTLLLQAVDEFQDIMDKFMAVANLINTEIKESKNLLPSYKELDEINKKIRGPISKDTLKWASFICLVVQASGHAIVAKYSRSVPGPHYLASTVVVQCELIKLIVCIAAHYYLRRRLPSESFVNILYTDVFGPASDCLIMIVPAICYFIQNMLLFIAVQHLDPATYQITSQLKILTTAFFSVIMLGTVLTKLKWTMLLTLLVGVVMVQLQGYSGGLEKQSGNHLIGFTAILARTTLSGFAGIWFEKALKGKNVSLFLRNIQLSLFSLIPGFLIAVCLIDGPAILENGFYQGYTSWTWAAIVFESAGGLIVAMVVKYADSILKVIATTIAFILSSGVSVYLFDVNIGPFFIFGSIIVLMSSQVYILGLPAFLVEHL